jgi:hypothetical protein
MQSALPLLPGSGPNVLRGKGHAPLQSSLCLLQRLARGARPFNAFLSRRYNDAESA